MSNYTYATDVKNITSYFRYIDTTIGTGHPLGIIILITVVAITFLVFFRRSYSDESGAKKAFIISSLTGLITSIIFTIISILSPIYIVLMIVLFAMSIAWSFAGK